MAPSDLPPLYLMLACLSGAYGLLVLKPLAYPLYFLASLPGIGRIAGVDRLGSAPLLQFSAAVLSAYSAS
ncbi:MAG: hypothetical protein R3F37_09120 [Candidatus Competibacteraceae bacterium]